MAWVSLKCPHCKGIAKKVPINASVSHQVTHTRCEKCRERIVYENTHGKVKVYKD